MMFTVSDLCLYAFCPRAAYFTHVVPTALPLPAALGLPPSRARGHALAPPAALQSWAGASGRGQWRSSPMLRSERLGLTGRVDFVLETATEAIPAHLINPVSRLRRHHRILALAYARLVEETLRRPVRRVLLLPLGSPRPRVVQSGPEAEVELANLLRNLRRLVQSEAWPPRPARRETCQECERRRFCADWT